MNMAGISTYKVGLKGINIATTKPENTTSHNTNSIRIWMYVHFLTHTELHLHRAVTMTDADNIAYLLVLYLSYSTPPVILPTKCPNDRVVKINGMPSSLPET